MTAGTDPSTLAIDTETDPLAGAGQDRKLAQSVAIVVFAELEREIGAAGLNDRGAAGANAARH